MLGKNVDILDPLLVSATQSQDIFINLHAMKKAKLTNTNIKRKTCVFD